MIQAESPGPSQIEILTAPTNTSTVSYITNQVIVSRLAGSGTKGFADGIGANAQFDGPNAGFVDSAGSVYVADWYNHRIRKVSPSGEVTTLVGTGVAGYADGPATNALFFNPVGICVDAAGTVFVADAGNNRIRRISPEGTVNTVAGSGEKGYLDGPGDTARFDFPNDLAVDTAGNPTYASLTITRCGR